MNQEDLARLVDISQQHLSKIERGLLQPSKDIRERMAAVLGVAVSDLFPEHAKVAS